MSVLEIVCEDDWGWMTQWYLMTAEVNGDVPGPGPSCVQQIARSPWLTVELRARPWSQQSRSQR